MSRLRFAAPDAGFRDFLAAHTRDCCLLFGPLQRWTAGASYFRHVPAEPHQTVRFLVLWMPAARAAGIVVSSFIRRKSGDTLTMRGLSVALRAARSIAASSSGRSDHA